jgi:hypothetical protein
LRRTLCCQIPELTFDESWFTGSSYGQLICGDDENYLVVDVFTGAKVLPPQLPFDDGTSVSYGMLTAPFHYVTHTSYFTHNQKRAIVSCLIG